MGKTNYILKGLMMRQEARTARLKGFPAPELFLTELKPFAKLPKKTETAN